MEQKQIIKTGEGHVQHQYSMEEVSSFVRLINSTLKVNDFDLIIMKDDPLVKNKLPVNPDNEEVFEKVGDGLILAYSSDLNDYH